MSEMVDELWKGLEHNAFHVTDGRSGKLDFSRGLEIIEIFRILHEKQIPPEHSKNVRLIFRDKEAAFLYALSSDKKHFWGISPSVISHLVRKLEGLSQPRLVVPWALVLLDGDWRTGYWFDYDTVLRRQEVWRPRGDVAYLIGGNVSNCRRDTDGSTRFLSSATLFKLLTALMNEYSLGSIDKPATA